MELPIQVAQSAFFADGATRLYDDDETRFSSFVENVGYACKTRGKTTGSRGANSNSRGAFPLAVEGKSNFPDLFPRIADALQISLWRSKAGKV